MSLMFLLPALAVTLLAFALTAAPRSLPPRATTWTITLVLVAAATAVVATVASVSVMFLGQVTDTFDLFGWCRALASHHDRISPLVGAASLASAAWMIVSASRALARRRAATRGLPRSDEAVQIIASDVPVAFAVPGRPGHVVVSSGMLAVLTPAEREVVFAHEHAHLRHRHHLHLGIAEVISGALPFLGRLRTTVRFATERWADEDTAKQLGDRGVVASAIGRAALASSPAAYPALSIGGGDVVARMEAMLAQPTQTGPHLVIAAVTLTTIGALAGSAVQLHHVALMLAHLCT